jgi:hypothetical protein
MIIQDFWFGTFGSWRLQGFRSKPFQNGINHFHGGTDHYHIYNIMAFRLSEAEDGVL